MSNENVLKKSGFPPERLGISGLTGNQIKYIAAAMMLIDHVYQMFAAYGAPSWLDWLGRPVAPIFLFMLAEGFYYTRSKGKYLLHLFIGSELMNIANYLLSIWVPNNNAALINNIFSTFFITALYMFCADMIKSGVKEKKAGKIALSVLLMLAPVAGSALVLFVINGGVALSAWLVIAATAIPNLITLEGGFLFVILGLLFYLLRNKRLLQALPLVAFSAYCFFAGAYDIEWMAIFALVFLLLYNGKRGGGSPAFNKYFFYVFYPAHIYILYIISALMQKTA
ncbi:MAG: conjugal transfer protein TraX [Oscillospiraceae bacterium]|jgi:hypothetical protein|nr:conjugal transfer protein TraX [Oscillospiraceae bacterium]